MKNALTRLDDPDHRAWLWVGCALFATLSLFFWLSYLPVVLLFDSDSYFHLAAAREYGQNGMLHALPWARFSIMRDGYGDKELLFHLLLVPFATWMNPEQGCKLALSLLDAAFITSIAVLAGRALGARGLLWSLLIALGSGSLALRLIRLRPELLAIILLLWFTWFCAQRRWLAAAALALLYALSYTALQALLGLCGLWFIAERLINGRWAFRVVLIPSAAVALGVLVHPQFPANARMWLVQNFSFWVNKAALPVGAEFQPLSTATWLRQDFGFLLAGAGLLLCARAGTATRKDAAPRSAPALYFLIGAGAFSALFMFMSRFTSFAVPFCIVGACWELHRRGLRPGNTIAHVGGIAVPALLAVLVGVLGVKNVGGVAFSALAGGGAMSEPARENLRAIGRALPDGAKVAATWGEAEDYLFWAPQARFLNVLDPVFMFVPHPELFAAQQAIFDGKPVDIPLIAKQLLDSDYLAFSVSQSPSLAPRVKADPRMRQLVAGHNRLFAIAPGKNRDFVLDWQVAKGGAGGMRVPYPRAGNAAARALEGYVDLSRVPSAAGKCVLLTHDWQEARAAQTVYELGGVGPFALWLDGQQRVQTAAPSPAIIGQGVGVVLQLSAGAHQIAVRSCPAAGRHMFYLLRRSL